jgi:hypothetical protein
MSKEIDNIITAVTETLQMLPLITSKEVEAMHKQRVFNRATGANGEQLQYKSTYYKSKREAKGRQTNNIDFEFEGVLRRSLKVGLDGENVVYGVDSSKNKNISNEKLLNVINDKYNNFMGISENEKEQAIKTAQRFFKETVIRKLNEVS